MGNNSSVKAPVPQPSTPRSKDTEYIYVLKLECKKYYVGKTKNVNNRFKQHQNGYGAEWTKKYKPLSMESYHLSTGPYDEDNTVKEMMGTHGIDNVRGGTYSQCRLSDETMEFLLTEIRHADNKCLKCGNSGHMIRFCPVTSTKSKPSTVITKSRKQPSTRCVRCDNFGHQIDQCNVSSKKDGTHLCMSVTQKGTRCRFTVPSQGHLCSKHKK